MDPTGPFVIYAGQYLPDELAFLEAADPPMFVAVTGKARTFQPDDSDRVFTSVRPESISEVDAERGTVGSFRPPSRPSRASDRWPARNRPV